MISSITKPKIPKEYTYVLKTSQLKELLESKNIKTDVQLVYWLPQKIGSILEAHFWSPNENVPYNRFYIRAGAVRSCDVHLAKDQLIRVVFPAFSKWLETYSNLPSDSSQLYKKPYFNAVFSEKGTNIETFNY